MAQDLWEAHALLVGGGHQLECTRVSKAATDSHG